MNKFRDIIFVVGGIAMIVGACLYITRWSGAPYVFLSGAILFALKQITDRYRGNNFVVKRLLRQQILGALLLVVAGVLMLVLHHNEWVLCLLIAAVIGLYTSLRLSAELRKEENHP